ncbi:MAG: LD-carboxypeptidase [Rickettsiaceae bacterium]
MVKFNKSEDLIYIIAPGSGCYNAKGKLFKAKELLSKHGFQVSYNKDIFSGDVLPFFASPYKSRLESLHDALNNSRVKIIWAFRGGYGSTQLINDALKVKPLSHKVLIGFSDITALHIIFNQYYNMPSIHTSVLTSLLSQQKHAIYDVISVLYGSKIDLALRSINQRLNDCEAQLIGGNLTILCNLIGTKATPNFNNKILLIEEINEQPYVIHRNLTYLKNVGAFDNLKALLFGDFINCGSNIENIVQIFVSQNMDKDIPVYYIDGVGHGNYNHPLILGANAKISNDRLRQQSQFSFA